MNSKYRARKFPDVISTMRDRRLHAAVELNPYIFRLLKMGHLGSPDTSVSNHLTRLSNPEDEIIEFNVR
jgi:hypothetical protein